MPANLPPKTTVVNRAGDAWNKLVSNSRSHQPIQSDGMLTGHTIHGVIREPEQVMPTYGAAPVASSGGMTYRGVWTNTPTTPYMAQDVVIVLSAGPAAGTYVSIEDNNVALPDVGPGWVQIAPGSAIGRWS